MPAWVGILKGAQHAVLRLHPYWARRFRDCCLRDVAKDASTTRAGERYRRPMHLRRWRRRARGLLIAQWVAPVSAFADKIHRLRKRGRTPARVRFDLNESCTSTRRVMSQRMPLPMDGSPFGFSGPLMTGGCAGGGSGAGMRFRWLVGTRGTCDS